MAQPQRWRRCQRTTDLGTCMRSTVGKDFHCGDAAEVFIVGV